ncbi:glutamate--tRNA ligase [candidate division WWE3 bacterium RBG_19FT_COMBO_53_11]|uniref:Glutamate--tRNA ligase n=1 Tax=candidate division WWE3 bacterium RBG_19FT_COMBO_53_11 TaxID=1802613 RepID=A0A1F4UJ46_UNCKA|nr:MAG: glutamate--tRNA ligase [candidate division WWE3 bacterium RBG_16_52_45]OGC44840.1 MAG: glutamate--tRNA ligase [candidate division WWE3 bacterium RBG_19FT_COMBO_53_11]
MAVKSQISTVKTRIAPSPTGAPHVGTAYVALFNWAFARQNKGKFLLRIEDTDRARFVPQAESQILEALNWLGLSWDEGPFRQSERLPIYLEHAEDLIKKDHAYYCFCSETRLEDVRQKAQKEGLPPRYDRFCRKLDPKIAAGRAKKEKFVVRLKVPEEGTTSFADLIRGEIHFENKVLDDQVLIKSDGYPTYHLAVVVDDHQMGVTHVLRGEEWISSTPKHILLYQAFGWDLPKFAHFPVLREASRAKLSKRHGAVGILEFKEEGYLPEALLNFLALLGWSHPQGKEIFSLDDFAEKFDLRRISTTAPVFDREKLDWMNGEYIRQLGTRQLGIRLKEYLKEYRGMEIDPDILERIAPLVRERIKKLGELEALAGFFFTDVAWTKEELLGGGESGGSASEKLSAAAEILEGFTVWETKKLEEKVRGLAQEKKWEAPALFMLLRVAVTGQTVSPPLFECMEVLGKEKTVSRIKGALKILEAD